MNNLSPIIYPTYSDASHWVYKKTALAKGKVNNFFNYAPPLKNLWPRIERSLVFAGLVAFSNHIMTTPPFNNQILELLSKTYVFSITFLFGIITAFDSYLLPTEWEIQKLTQDQSKKNVVLHCFQRHFDVNGAASRVSKRTLDVLKKLSKTHSIVHVSVGSAKDINAAVDQINARGQKVQILWVNAHGRPRSMLLGSEIIKSWESKNPFMRLIEKVLPLRHIDSLNFSKLAPNADIVLESCSVGKEDPRFLSFAEWAQIYAGRNRKVHAPSSTGVASGTYFDETCWGRKKFHFSNLDRMDMNDFPAFPTPIFKDVTANISYGSALKKARKLGYFV